jgi:Rrf2 family protein
VIRRTFDRVCQLPPNPIDASDARSYTQSRRNHSDIEDDPLSTTTQTAPTPTPATPTTRTPFHGSGAIAFSTKGEYGVRLMVQLGRHVGRGPASLAEIAAEEDLPRAYLEQLVVSLREAGLVTSTRGAHGGYELARPPETISMAEVLRALEGPIAPMMCASDDPEHATLCDRSARCTVNILWVRVRDAVAGALDSMTLADLVPPRTPSPVQPTTIQGA